jgi:diguanylate cyclase (GGDEF)-like protein
LKPLNDNFGHEVGDTAIVATGEVLRQTVGACDIVGRLGGDEFLIVLCHAHSMEGNEVIQRIHDNLAARTIMVDNFAIPLTASVGVALTRCGPETDPMELVREADHAMYEAKKAARRVTFDISAFARRGSGEEGAE